MLCIRFPGILKYQFKNFAAENLKLLRGHCLANYTAQEMLVACSMMEAELLEGIFLSERMFLVFATLSGYSENDCIVFL